MGESGQGEELVGRNVGLQESVGEACESGPCLQVLQHPIVLCSAPLRDLFPQPYYASPRSKARGISRDRSTSRTAPALLSHGDPAVWDRGQQGTSLEARVLGTQVLLEGSRR